MKREQKNFQGSDFTSTVKVIEQDLSNEYGIDSTAFSVLECLSDKVSPDLWNLLYQLLLPFSEEMQLEMADDLLDFTCDNVIHTTGCLSADAALKTCYVWIAEEKGISLKDIMRVIFNTNINN